MGRGLIIARQGRDAVRARAGLSACHPRRGSDSFRCLRLAMTNPLRPGHRVPTPLPGRPLSFGPIQPPRCGNRRAFNPRRGIKVSRETVSVLSSASVGWFWGQASSGARSRCHTRGDGAPGTGGSWAPTDRPGTLKTSGKHMEFGSQTRFARPPSPPCPGSGRSSLSRVCPSAAPAQASSFLVSSSTCCTTRFKRTVDW